MIVDWKSVLAAKYSTPVEEMHKERSVDVSGNAFVIDCHDNPLFVDLYSVPFEEGRKRVSSPFPTIEEKEDVVIPLLLSVHDAPLSVDR